MGVTEIAAIVAAIGGSGGVGALLTSYYKGKEISTGTQRMIMEYANEATEDRQNLRKTSEELIALGFSKERSEHYSRRYMEKAQPAVHVWGPAPELPLELEPVFGHIVREASK